MDKTLSIIKPDATSRNISGQINSIIEKSGLKIIAQKMIKLNLDQAKIFVEAGYGPPCTILSHTSTPVGNPLDIIRPAFRSRMGISFFALC